MPLIQRVHSFNIRQGFHLGHHHYRFGQVLGVGGNGMAIACHRSSEPDRQLVAKLHLGEDLNFNEEVVSEARMMRLAKEAGIRRHHGEYFVDVLGVGDMTAFERSRRNLVEHDEDSLRQVLAITVMTRAAGRCLHDVVRDGRARICQHPTAARRVIRHLAKALDILHQARIFHLDLKPLNIILNEATDSIVLIDFGAAVHLRDTEARPALLEVQCCTYAYASPFMHMGLPYSPQANDLWSFGCTIFEILTGRILFDFDGFHNNANLFTAQAINFRLTRYIVNPPSAVIAIRGLLNLDERSRIEHFKRFDNWAYIVENLRR